MEKQASPKNRQELEARIISQVWKDEAYKQEFLSNPKAVIEREISISLSPEMTVQVLQETPTTLYLVIPRRSDQSELTEDQLETVAGGGFTWPGGDLVSALHESGQDLGHAISDTFF